GGHAVRSVSFELKAGEILALIGPNGAGKSTCFDMLNGQKDPDSGRITLLGEDTSGMPPRALWRLGVGRTFQITATFPTMALRERIELMRLTARIAREQSIGVLFTEHDMDVVFEHADRILVLNRGSLIAEGTPEQVRGNREVRAVYLGEGLVYDARHREGFSA